MAASLAPNPILQFFDNGGRPMNGGSVLTQVGGVNYPVYQDSAGLIPLPNPVPLNSRGEVSNAVGISSQLFLSPGISYTFTLFDVGGNQVNQAANVQALVSAVQLTAPVTDRITGDGSTTTFTLSANPGNVNNLRFTLGGAGQTPGVDYTLSGLTVTCTTAPPAGVAGFFNYTVALPVGSIDSGSVQYVPSGGGAVTRVAQTKFLEMLPSVKDYGAVGDGVANDLLAIQAAYLTNSDVYWPNGTYNLGNATWTPPVSMRALGQSRRGVKLTRTGAGPIITFAYGTIDPYFENIEFSGVGNTGMTVASTAGALQGYLIRPHIKSCDFDYDLAYGINADLIFATIEKSTFGYYGVGSVPAPGASTFVSIKSYSYPSTANYTNLNTVRNCIFQRSGSLTVPGIDLSGGTAWLFDSNDFEQGGMVLSAVNVQLIKFSGTNWIEANNSTTGLIFINTSTTPTDLVGINFNNNTCRSLIQYVSGATAGLNIYNCAMAMNSPTYPIYDTAALSFLLPANGSVSFYQNTVSGGNAANKCVTATEFRGGKTSPRVVLNVDTTGSGTLNYCSDPGATIATRTGTGDISINLSQPIASSAALMSAGMNPVPGQGRVLWVSSMQVRIQLFSGAGAATDGIAGVQLYCNG